MATLSTKELKEILAVTLSGMSVDEFQAEVKKWLATAKHPRYQCLYTKLSSPMDAVQFVEAPM